MRRLTFGNVWYTSHAIGFFLEKTTQNHKTTDWVLGIPPFKDRGHAIRYKVYGSIDYKWWVTSYLLVYKPINEFDVSTINHGYVSCAHQLG
jgi:hypothetical protein